MNAPLESSPLEQAIDLWRAGCLKEAETLARTALQAEPTNARALNTIGGILIQSDHHAVGMAFVKRSIALAPEVGAFYNTQAGALLARGDAAGAVESFRKALEIDPQRSSVRSNLILALQYLPTTTPELSLHEAREWGSIHAQPSANRSRFRSRNADPDRLLRIGYVSADFHRHPVGYFLEPVLPHHNRQAVEIFCYSNQGAPYNDDLTARLRDCADHWRDVSALEHHALAAQVERDAIDVLVDLSGHTAHHRLKLFARRAAPVQASWLGYCGTTGVREMDYLLLDPHLCPPGAERFYSEQCLRLPDSFLCYTPQGPAPEPVPRGDRPLTFGCFNKLGKITPQVAAVWAQILHRVPGSRISLMSGAFSDPGVQRYYHSLFADHGIEPPRVILLGKRPYEQYMRTFQEIDIALDPFPFNGCTTTVEALSAGVPVVTLVGEGYPSRMGLSILSTVGLPELAAFTAEEYVDKAVALAGAPNRLAEWRRTLRPMMETSPLCDGAGLAGDLETAYRQMWTRWCSGEASA